MDKAIILVVLSVGFAAGCQIGGLYDSRCPAFEDPWNPRHIAHEWSCEQFYTCNAGCKYLMHCPSGQHFGEQIQRCDWPYFAQCNMETGTTTTKNPEAPTEATTSTTKTSPPPSTPSSTLSSSSSTSTPPPKPTGTTPNSIPTAPGPSSTTRTTILSSSSTGTVWTGVPTAPRPSSGPSSTTQTTTRAPPSTLTGHTIPTAATASTSGTPGIPTAPTPPEEGVTDLSSAHPLDPEVTDASTSKSTTTKSTTSKSTPTGLPTAPTVIPTVPTAQSAFLYDIL